MKKITFVLLCLFLMAFAQENPLARKAFDRGNDLYKKRKYKEALVELTTVVKLDSYFADAYYVRSFVYRQLREYEKGFHDMEKYLELNKKNPEAYLEMSIIRDEVIKAKYTGGDLRYATTDVVDKETIFKSINDVDKAISIDSTLARAFYMKGGWLECLCKCNDVLKTEFFCDTIFKKAIQLYTKAILLEPKNGFIYYGRANAKLEIKDSLGACLDFKTAFILGDENSKDRYDELCKKMKGKSIAKGCCDN